MTQPHETLFHKQLSPLKRRHVLTWFFENKATRGQCLHHPAFIRALSEVQKQQAFDQLHSLHSKIAFILLSEFGPAIAGKPMYNTLIRQVAQRLKANQ